jgi:putative flippase GtrA
MPATAPDRLATGRGRTGTMLRYAGGSVIATVCSEATFVLLYGLMHAGTTVSSVLAWFAGTVPNYWLNRRWAWGRTGRPSLRREVAPYVAIILATLALATLTTKGLDSWLRHLETAEALRVALVAGGFLGVYVVVFVLRFLLLNRLFGRLTDQDATLAADSDGAHR